MGRQAAVALYVLALVAVVVGLDSPVLQESVLGAADGERRGRPGVLGVLSEIPETSMRAAAAMRAFKAGGRRAAHSTHHCS
jgi:hypothetical protein